MQQTKPRFGRLLRPPAWKRSGTTLVEKGTGCICRTAFMKLRAISESKLRFIGEQLASGLDALLQNLASEGSTTTDVIVAQMMWWKSWCYTYECFRLRSPTTPEHAIQIANIYLLNWQSPRCMTSTSPVVRITTLELLLNVLTGAYLTRGLIWMFVHQNLTLAVYAMQ